MAKLSNHGVEVGKGNAWVLLEHGSMELALNHMLQRFKFELIQSFMI